jgi:hypothetical protein
MIFNLDIKRNINTTKLLLSNRKNCKYCYKPLLIDSFYSSRYIASGLNLDKTSTNQMKLKFRTVFNFNRKLNYDNEDNRFLIYKLNTIRCMKLVKLNLVYSYCINCKKGAAQIE